MLQKAISLPKDVVGVQGWAVLPVVLKIWLHCEGHSQLLSEERLNRCLAEVDTHACTAALGQVSALHQILESRPLDLKKSLYGNLSSEKIRAAPQLRSQGRRKHCKAKTSTATLFGFDSCVIVLYYNCAL